MALFRKKVSTDVSPIAAYESCVGLLEESPYPGVLGIYVNQALLFVLAGALLAWAFTDGILSVFIGNLVVPIFVSTLYPTYIKYLSLGWNFVKDLLVSEYRSTRLKRAYLRNFYD